MLGLRVSSRFVLASVRPGAAVCVVCECIYVGPRRETGGESMSWTCTAEQSDGIGCQRPVKPWPEYQRVRHETRSRGRDAWGLKWLSGHCVCAGVCRMTWICPNQDRTQPKMNEGMNAAFLTSPRSLEGRPSTLFHCGDTSVPVQQSIRTSVLMIITDAWLHW